MPVTACTFRWTEAYSVHIDVLDRQHMKLIDTLNELDQALRTGSANLHTEEILLELTEYAKVHFACEEELMAKHGYPGLSIHKARHEDFVKRINEFIESHKACKPGVAVSLLFFVQDWLKQHLMKTDKQYSAFLNARGVH